VLRRSRNANGDAGGDAAWSLHFAGAVRALLILPFVVGCMVGEDEATDGSSGASVGIARGLKHCTGKASTAIPNDGRYIITTFGGPGDHQAMSCGGFADGTTWYAASRQRYGCGAKLQVEANGKCVVVAALDYGPDVCVENAAGAPIIDVSPKVSRELFGEAGAGYSDRLFVTVTPVAAATPLGLCTATPAQPLASCASTTLDRDVDHGTCVQDAVDAKWYQCTDGVMTPRANSTGCASAFAYCSSATLGKNVPPRTCVQARSDSKWYQCNGQSWVTPVDTAAQSGPIGTCATWNPL
jgi:hypothetical protein